MKNMKKKKKKDTVYENIARARNVGKILLYTGYLTRQSNEIFSVLFYWFNVTGFLLLCLFVVHGNQPRLELKTVNSKSSV